MAHVLNTGRPLPGTCRVESGGWEQHVENVGKGRSKAAFIWGSGGGGKDTSPSVCQACDLHPRNAGEDWPDLLVAGLIKPGRSAIKGRMPDRSLKSPQKVLFTARGEAWNAAGATPLPDPRKGSWRRHRAGVADCCSKNSPALGILWGWGVLPHDTRAGHVGLPQSRKEHTIQWRDQDLDSLPVFLPPLPFRTSTLAMIEISQTCRGLQPLDFSACVIHLPPAHA